MSNRPAVRQPIGIGDKILEQVDDYKYLGQIVSADANCESENRPYI